MRLTRIELENFRGFGQATFDLMRPDGLKPHMTIALVGPGGSGKTAVLQAVAGLFSGLASKQLQGINKWRVESSGIEYHAEGFSLDDVRQGEEYFRLAVTWTDTWPIPEPTPPSFDCELHFFPVERIVKNYSNARPIIMHQQSFAEIDGLFFSSLSPGELIRWRALDAINEGVGLIIGFDELRLLPRARVGGPNLEQITRHPCLASLAQSDKALETGLRFGQLKQWIVNLDYARLKTKGSNRAPVLWACVVGVLNKLLAPNEFIEVDERNELRFRTPSGTVRLEALSASFRSLFVIAVDLLLRLSLSRKEGDPLAAEAVCLIDEIDAHLDPDQQERIMGDLQSIFPEVQFIVTTHSDLVVGSIAREQIFVLGEE